jgi:cell division protein FtsZ
MLMQGASNMGLHEVSAASALIQESVSPNDNVIFGFSNDDSLGDEIRVTVIAAGFDGGAPVRKPSVSIPTKTNTDQIQVIGIEEPLVSPVVIDQPAEFQLAEPKEDEDTFGGYLASTEDSAPKTEVIDLPTSPKAKDDGAFGDQLDIPDFLK